MSGTAASAAVAADSSPEISAAAMPTVKCVYALLKSNPAIRWVNAYAIDGNSSAVEYAFRDKDSVDVVSDILLSGPLGGKITFSGTTEHDHPEDRDAEAIGFFATISDDLNAKCHISPGLDNLLPPPKSRQEWRRIDLGN